MIGISKLYCSTIEPSDPLRYGRKSENLPSHLLQFSSDKKPVVVWNITQRCNLNCVHCYSHSRNISYNGELTTGEGRVLIDDLAQFGSPVILFSGGEPLIRPDIFELIDYARNRKMRTVLSTNGTLIKKDIAKQLNSLDLSYAGISLDGLEKTNDKFRGMKGAFKEALQGIRHCKDAGIKVGLRLTINKRNVQDIPGIFKLIEDEDIQRICFYHLVYSGRGSKLVDEDLSHSDARKTIDLIINLTKGLQDKGLNKEVLTVDNHADGVYLYLRLLKENPQKARDVLKLLQMNGGNSTGQGIACVSWDGSVHADQFWRHHSFGNVKEKKFSTIWTDLSEPLMAKLKNKKKYLKGRCSRCKFIDICNGNLRVRAEAITGDIWENDPACYLTDEEIEHNKI